MLRSLWCLLGKTEKVFYDYRGNVTGKKCLNLCVGIGDEPERTVRRVI